LYLRLRFVRSLHANNIFRKMEFVIHRVNKFCSNEIV